jgi:hypothetical protein
MKKKKEEYGRNDAGYSFGCASKNSHIRSVAEISWILSTNQGEPGLEIKGFPGHQ